MFVWIFMERSASKIRLGEKSLMLTRSTGGDSVSNFNEKEWPKCKKYKDKLFQMRKTSDSMNLAAGKKVKKYFFSRNYIRRNH